MLRDQPSMSILWCDGMRKNDAFWRPSLARWSTIRSTVTSWESIFAMRTGIFDRHSVASLRYWVHRTCAESLSVVGLHLSTADAGAGSCAPKCHIVIIETFSWDRP